MKKRKFRKLVERVARELAKPNPYIFNPNSGPYIFNPPRTLTILKRFRDD